MAIRIKRSSGNAAPESLVSGQLAYVEGATNGGTLYIGEIGGTVREIAGKKFVDKLNGIEAGAQVNTVDSVAGKTGVVTLEAADITDFLAEVEAVIGDAELKDLADVYIPTEPGNGQVLTWDATEDRWYAAAPSTGVTTFVALNDTPNSFAGAANYYVKVNGDANALVFSQDVDDGTF